MGHELGATLDCAIQMYIEKLWVAEGEQDLHKIFKGLLFLVANIGQFKRD